MTTETTTTITITIDGDTIRSLRGDDSEGVGDERLARYEELTRAACEARWPDAEVLIDRSQRDCSGATRPSTIHVYDAEGLPAETPADEDALRDVLGAAWEAACGSVVPEPATVDPVTTGGWYAREDGTVGLYRWQDGRVVCDRVVTDWAAVGALQESEQAEEREREVALDAAAKEVR